MIKDVGHRFRWCERAAAHDSGLAATIYDAAGGIAYNGGLCHQREGTAIPDDMRVRGDQGGATEQGGLCWKGANRLPLASGIQKGRGAKASLLGLLPQGGESQQAFQGLDGT